MSDIYFICPHCFAIVAVQDNLLYSGTVIDCIECGGRIAETKREKGFWGNDGHDSDGEEDIE